MWYNKDLLANILSMAEVRKVCHITIDTAAKAAINVHRKDGSIMKFLECASGLYYFDTKVSNPLCGRYHGHVFLNTIAENKHMFAQREIDGADRARALYQKIGRPSEREFSRLLTTNQICNCPVTADNAKRALRIYGPDIATLRENGKRSRTEASLTTRQ